MDRSKRKTAFIREYEEYHRASKYVYSNTPLSREFQRNPVEWQRKLNGKKEQMNGRIL